VFSDILERVRELAADQLADGTRDANAPRLRQCPQACADIRGFSCCYSLKIHPDTERNAPICSHVGVALGHGTLHLNGTAHRLDRTGALDEHAVAGGLQDPAAMLCNLGIDDFATKRLQAFEHPFLAGFYQTRIAGPVGGETGGGGEDQCAFFRPSPKGASSLPRRR